MTDKTFRQLTGAGSVVAGDITAIQNVAGNSRKVTMSVLRNFMASVVTASLNTHIANNEAHGISTFVATLVGAEDAEDFLGLLGFTISGTSLSFAINLGVATFTARQHSIGASSEDTFAYGDGHEYTSKAVAWTSGDDFDGSNNAIETGVKTHSLTEPTVNNSADNTATFWLIGFGK